MKRFGFGKVFFTGTRFQGSYLSSESVGKVLLPVRVLPEV